MCARPSSSSSTLSSSSSAPVWTLRNLRRLLHALILSHASISTASTLLPFSATQIATALRLVSRRHRNPVSWSDTHHALAVLRLTARYEPPVVDAPPSRISVPPRARIALQLVPFDERDAAAVRARAENPFLEVILRAHRRVWDVIAHVYRKWQMLFRFVTLEHVDVDASVLVLLPNGTRRIRLQYRIVQLRIEVAPLRFLVRCHRDIDNDDDFWTGGAGSAANVPPLDVGCDSLFACVHENVTEVALDVSTAVRKRSRSDDTHNEMTTRKRSRVIRAEIETNETTSFCFDDDQINRSATINGETAVFSRLRSHLQRLGDDDDDDGDGGVVEATTNVEVASTINAFDGTTETSLGWLFTAHEH